MHYKSYTFTLVHSLKILKRYSEAVVFKNFLKIIYFYDKCPLYCASAYHSVMKLYRIRTGFLSL